MHILKCDVTAIRLLVLKRYSEIFPPHPHFFSNQYLEWLTDHLIIIFNAIFRKRLRFIKYLFKSLKYSTKISTGKLPIRCNSSTHHHHHQFSRKTSTAGHRPPPNVATTTGPVRLASIEFQQP
ncbi:hypothetical protein PYW08_011293 [Mythimna loreyi]|uniref:Uncharacterized protein n=1 Tax=Mythimna loreyi TaxID=667449 RepID=A0ACC2Q4T7_9NEOP|nr:hypothetical protein PYW08_011293 [Mythimna loreyi]